MNILSIPTGYISFNPNRIGNVGAGVVENLIPFYLLPDKLFEKDIPVQKYMYMILRIGNMFCECSKMVVRDTLLLVGLNPLKISLGEVILKEKPDEKQLAAFGSLIRKVGLTLIHSKSDILIDSIKVHAWNYVQLPEPPMRNFSEYVSEKLRYEYNYLSNVFSEKEKISIVHYINLLKMEVAKDLINTGNITFSEIAQRLNYANLSHLSYIFKKITGTTLSQYKKSRNLDRKAIHEITKRAI